MKVERLGLEEVYKGKDEVLAAKEQEIAAKERALSDERQRVSSLADECAALILGLQAHIKTLQVWLIVVGVMRIL